MGRNKFIAEEVKELKFAIKKNPSKMNIYSVQILKDVLVLIAHIWFLKTYTMR